jgi:hypothetical protein
VYRREGYSVTSWGRMGGEGEGWGKKVCEKGQNKLLGRGVMDFSTGEGGRVKRIKVGMRR